MTMCIISCLVILVLLSIDDSSLIRYVPDAESYISMAEGSNAGVRLHHAKRMLHPYLIGKLSSFIGVDAAFILVGTLSLFVFLSILFIFQTIANPSIVYSSYVLIVFYPFILDVYYNLYIQTLFFIALTCIFYLALIREHYWAAIILLILMLLTRDESILVAISLTFAAVLSPGQSHRCLEPYKYVTAVILTCISVNIFLECYSSTTTNLHNTSSFLFSIIRMPIFYARNLLGIEHWVDAYASLPSYKHPPLYSWEAPSWIQQLSSVKKVGIYNWSAENVKVSAQLVLSSFGTLPCVVIFLIKNFRMKIFSSSIAVNAAFVFGILIFLLAPGLGPANIRYYVCAWPLFFIFIPFTMRRFFKVEESLLAAVYACSFIGAWLPYIMNSFDNNNVWAVLSCESLIYMFTWHFLKKLPIIAEDKTIQVGIQS